MAEDGSGKRWRPDLPSRSAVDIEAKVLIFATDVAGGSDTPAARLKLDTALEVGYCASKE